MQGLVGDLIGRTARAHGPDMALVWYIGQEFVEPGPGVPSPP